MIHGNRLGGYAIDPEDFSRHAEFDPVFKVPVWNTVDHTRIHEGCAFFAGVVDLTMGAADTLAVAFRVPAGDKYAHLVIGWDIKVAGHVDVIRAATWDTSSGTLGAAHNRLDGAGASALEEDKTATPAFSATGSVLLNPTTLAGTTIIPIGYGFASKQSGNQNRGQAEWVCIPGVQYAVRLTADDAANSGYLQLDWYEHTHS